VSKGERLMLITLTTLADLLDQIAIEMGHTLLPPPTDVDRAAKAYAVGMAAASVKQTAAKLRRLTGGGHPHAFHALPPTGAWLS
jgi:hypothetical protein